MVPLRISALFCICLVPADSIAMLCSKAMANDGWDQTSLRRKISYVFVVVLMNLAWMVYVLAWLVIIVEMFRTLAFQPPDVYVGTWTVRTSFRGLWDKRALMMLESSWSSF